VLHLQGEALLSSQGILVVTPCSVVVGYQRFGGRRCFAIKSMSSDCNAVLCRTTMLHLQGEALLSSQGILVVTPCSVVVGYQRFGGPRCFIFRLKLCYQVKVFWL
jgi:hypothetical protein